MTDGSVCSTCQLWKLGGTSWNFPNSWMVLPLCLTLLLTTDILQGLTVIHPSSSICLYHKLLQIILLFFCEAPRLWNELPTEIVSSTSFASFKCSCMFLYHEQYIHFIFMFLFLFFVVVVVVVVVVGTWYVLACLLSMYPMSCSYINYYRKNMHALQKQIAVLANCLATTIAWLSFLC